MAQAFPRTSFSSSSLIRLLSDLDHAGIAQPKQSFAERMSQWLDWTDAISLAAALNTRPTPEPNHGCAAAAAAMPAAYMQLRDALAASVSADTLFVAGMAAPGRFDFQPLRQTYLSQQRTMENRIGTLRADVRAALATCSAELGRLAALDAVLHKALAARERHLLASVPVLLEKHFGRLRDGDDESSTPRQVPTVPAWFETGCTDMRAILLAELEIRLQPLAGMVAAIVQTMKMTNE